MFAELYVENLALIESARLCWDKGLNVLSGETGAGKSMVIDAVGLLLGSRASQDYIRKNESSCLVQGVFTPPFNTAVSEHLADIGLKAAADEDLILSRELNRDGKSVCRINMRQVPLAVFRDISRLLINIHGQMEHIILLENDRQRQLLDAFAGEDHKEALAKVAEAYLLWQEKAAELKKIQAMIASSDERRDFISFRLQEIEKAKLKPGELEDLNAQAKKLEAAESLADNAKKAWQNLSEGQNPPLSALTEARNYLAKLTALDEDTSALAERLDNIYYELEDLSLELRNYKDSIVDDPYQLNMIAERIHEIKGVCKKYGGDVDAVLALAEQYRQELAMCENSDEYLAACQKAEAKTKAAYDLEADRLTACRKQTALNLGQAITKELHYLQMPAAEFEITIEPDLPAEHGCDKVCFMVSPNPGEGMKAVAKIASGGEMSRIMLAVKVILAQADQVPTLIFDEIDTGLGGRALISVAEKLAEISRDTQAICVTHAPVLAAFADCNLQVSKHEQGERTITEVRRLNEQEKLEELCRMLAGDNVSAATIKQAQELIDLKP
jgi:DNA repair protein RecN (Recombination protein N)